MGGLEILALYFCFIFLGLWLDYVFWFSFFTFYFLLFCRCEAQLCLCGLYHFLCFGFHSLFGCWVKVSSYFLSLFFLFCFAFLVALDFFSSLVFAFSSISCCRFCIHPSSFRQLSFMCCASQHKNFFISPSIWASQRLLGSFKSINR